MPLGYARSVLRDCRRSSRRSVQPVSGVRKSPLQSLQISVARIVVAIETEGDNLRQLKPLYIDCGDKDQFNLLYGVRRFVRRLNELGIPHRYEEFPDNHTAVDYRMDESLPFLRGG